jgi:hypothetical protein
MGRAAIVVREASSMPLDFAGDVLVFPYTNLHGVAWEGCIDEWIGNTTSAADPEQLVFVSNGLRYYQIGAAGGGADLILVADDEDARIYYLNDFDQTLSLVSSTLREFLALLRPPE